jgi:hypothetical protein
MRRLTASCSPLSVDERLPIFVVSLKYRPPMVPIAGCYTDTGRWILGKADMTFCGANVCF